MSRRAASTAALAIIIVMVAAVAIGGYLMLGPKGAGNKTPHTGSQTSPKTSAKTTSTGFKSADITQITTSDQVLKLFLEFEYRYEASNGSYTRVAMHSRGYEAVNGTRCRVVDILLETREKAGEKLGREGGRVWVDEKVHRALKVARLDGETLYGVKANFYWNVLSLSIAMFFVDPTQMNLAWMLNTAPRGVEITYLGSQQASYGPTTLSVDKYRVVKPGDPEYAYWEVWVGRLPNHVNIMTHVKGGLKDGGWYVVEVLSLKPSP